MSLRSDEFYMHRALEEAERASMLGEVPVGAIIVDAEGEIIARGHNAPITRHDPCAHAEIQAIQQAARALGNYRLLGCTLYVTLEPCMMCLGAVINSRIQRVVYAAAEPKTGMVESRANLINQPWHSHRPVVEGGLLASRSQRMLKAFFAARRDDALPATSEVSVPDEACSGHSAKNRVENTR